MKKLLSVIVGIILVLTLVCVIYFSSSTKIENSPEIIPVTSSEVIHVTSPTKSNVYKIGSIISIHLIIPSDIPKDSLQFVFITSPTNGFAVKSGLATGISNDFQFTIPSQSCGEDNCFPVETGKYKVITKIYSNNVFKLSCINSPYCVYPDSDLIANGQSEEFVISASSN